MDISLVTAVAGNVNTGLQIAKAMLAMKVDTEVTAKTIELQGVLSSAIQRLLELQAGQFAEQARSQDLQRRFDDLLAENAKLKAFDVDASRYELRAIAEGAFAYVLKDPVGSSEPEHWLCASCFGDRRKAILQYSRPTLGRRIFSCPSCKTEVSINNPAAGVTIEAFPRARRMFPDGGGEPY